MSSAGGTVVEESTTLSPFTNDLPAGTRSVRMTDTAISNNRPIILQDFSPLSGTLEFGFDFYIETGAGSSATWQIDLNDGAFGNSGGREVARFLVEPDQFSAGSTGNPSSSINTQTWYQVRSTIDLSGSFQTTLTPFGGAAISMECPIQIRFGFLHHRRRLVKFTSLISVRA